MVLIAFNRLLTAACGGVKRSHRAEKVLCSSDKMLKEEDEEEESLIKTKVNHSHLRHEEQHDQISESSV